MAKIGIKPIPLSIPLSDLTKGMKLTITITGVEEWKFRLKIAKLIFRLGV